MRTLGTISPQMLWISPRVIGYSLNICSQIVFLNETPNLFLQLVTIVHMMALYFVALALLVGPTHHSFQFWEWGIWDGLSVIHFSSYCFRLMFRGVQYCANLLVSSCLLLGFEIPLSHIHCVRLFLWLMKDSDPPQFHSFTSLALFSSLFFSPIT